MVEYRSSVTFSESCICAFDPEVASTPECALDCPNEQITFLSEQDLSHFEEEICHCPLNDPECACTSSIGADSQRVRRDASSVSVLHARTCPPDGKEVCYRIRGEIRCIPCIEERVMCPLEEREVYCLDSTDEVGKIICPPCTRPPIVCPLYTVEAEFCKVDAEGNIVCPSCPIPRPRPPICPLCVSSDDGLVHCPPCPKPPRPTFTYPTPTPTATLEPTGPILCPLDIDDAGIANGDSVDSGSGGAGVDQEFKKRYCIEQADGSFWCPPCPTWPPPTRTITPTLTSTRTEPAATHSHRNQRGLSFVRWTPPTALRQIWLSRRGTVSLTQMDPTSAPVVHLCLDPIPSLSELLAVSCVLYAARCRG
ncbi:hypothetical protein IAU59_006740 [Kwoniella sp. CBS 9459]